MSSVFASESEGASPDVLAFAGLAEPSEAALAPAFALADDCGGRFIVDPDTGFISVASDEIVARDHGRTFAPRLRVHETNGDVYELGVRLTITGIVPQTAEADGFGAFAIDAPSAASMAPLEPPTPRAPEAAPAAVHTDALGEDKPAAFSAARWQRFQAFAAHPGHNRLRGRLAHGPFGAFTPATEEGLSLPEAVLTLPAAAFDYR